MPSREATAGALVCTGGDAEDERREQRLAARQRVGRGHSSGARRMVSRNGPSVSPGDKQKRQEPIGQDVPCGRGPTVKS